MSRDGTPHHQRERRQEPREEYLASLLDKLLEEAQELRDASPEQRLEEAADVYEVLRGLGSALGFSMDDVVKAARVKREERGGFEQRVWLERW